MALIRRIKLEIDSLRRHALADIKSKVSLNNIVEEVFSWVTAGQVITRVPHPRRKHYADVIYQSVGDHGVAVRASRVEFQGPKHDRTDEKEHRENSGWVFLALRWCAEAWIEEGIRAQEGEKRSAWGDTSSPGKFRPVEEVASEVRSARKA